MSELNRKPPWLKVRSFSGAGYDRVNRLLAELGVNTVCQAANCPNRGECFNRNTATFLILGPVCTRNCRFCDIRSGRPAEVDPDEPRRVAEAARRLGLRHVVITSVTRDDLADGGAGQFARTVELVRKLVRGATVEVLTPDFRDKPGARDTIIDCTPDVFNHNLETVTRLYPSVRPGASYEESLRLLRHVHDRSEVVTKTGIMVGMGESYEELACLFADIARSNVSMLTIGQYLAPSKNHLPVLRYVHPDEFMRLKEAAEHAGIRRVYSAPLVRSSYMADLHYLDAC